MRERSVSVSAREPWNDTGRIGSGDPFFVGDDRGPIRVRDSGRLFLGINDDYLPDNSGEFRVTVYY